MQPRPSDEIPRQQITELVRLATLAPSGHNTQPWKFAIHETGVRIYPDFSRRLPVVDPDDHALFISLGCALENLVIAARQSGLHAEVEYFPADAAQDGLSIYLSRGSRQSSERDSECFRAISLRQTTRRIYDGRMIPAADLQALERASRQDGIQFRLFTEDRDIKAVTEYVKEGNRRQFSNAAFVDELLSWIRFSRREIEEHHDGLTSAVMGLPSVPRWLGKSAMKLFAGPATQARQVEKQIRSSAALMLFIADRHDQRHWVDLGRSFERVALTATTLDIKQAHINMPCEVLEVREQFRSYLGLDSGEPLLLLRIGYAESMPRAPRRPLEDVIL